MLSVLILNNPFNNTVLNFGNSTPNSKWNFKKNIVTCTNEQDDVSVGVGEGSQPVILVLFLYSTAIFKTKNYPKKKKPVDDK